MHDTEMIQKEAGLLKEKMQVVKEEITKVSHHSMKFSFYYYYLVLFIYFLRLSS